MPAWREKKMETKKRLQYYCVFEGTFPVADTLTICLVRERPRPSLAAAVQAGHALTGENGAELSTTYGLMHTHAHLRRVFADWDRDATAEEARASLFLTMVVTMAALLFAASLTAAAVAPTVEIVPGVLMPMIVDGYDYGKQKKDTTWFVLGGRGVHTAESYFNQVAVGNSLRAQKVVVREEFLLQTKIECMGSVESTIAAGEDDLAQLGMDYVDLLLIHTPYLGWGEPYSNSSQGAAGKAARQATWRGMEALQRAGKAKAIGVELQHR